MLQENPDDIAIENLQDALRKQKSLVVELKSRDDARVRELRRAEKTHEELRKAHEQADLNAVRAKRRYERTIKQVGFFLRVHVLMRRHLALGVVCELRYARFT